MLNSPPAPGGRCAAPQPSATAPRRGPPNSGVAETPQWPGVSPFRPEKMVGKNGENHGMIIGLSEENVIFMG